MESVRVSVRRLVETVMIGGDITGGGSIRRMLDGAQGHRRLQDDARGKARSEVPVSADVTGEGFLLCVHGRVDLLWLDEEVPSCVEEIKTTYRDPASISEEEFPLHWAQAECYGHILCEKHGLESIDIRLTYAQVDGEAVSRMTRKKTAQALRERFASLTDAYLELLAWRRDWETTRDGSIRAAGFPFETYRAGQRELAARAYVTIRDGGRMLAEAPTGIGKSAAMLFAAVKAMGEGHVERIFYLTARGTTQQAAQDALRLMADGGLRIRSVTLAARERMCASPGSACSPEECPRALGHYDRFPKAAREILANADAHTPDSILAHCEKHSLCPFEFALDISLECDVIIGDYNYAFDPRAKLRRYFLDKSESALLIDEAHNLPDRAREMFSAELDAKELALLRREIGRVSRKGMLYKAVAALARALKNAVEPGERQLTELPEEVTNALAAFLEAAEPELSVPHPYTGPLLDCFFAALTFSNTRAYQKDFPDDYAALSLPPRVRLCCLHPAELLKETYELCRCAVLFSATLTPLDYFSELCGCGKDAPCVQAASPFPRGNLLTMLAPLPTRYRDREQSAKAVADAIAAMTKGRENGNYLAFFPSYKYLSLVRPLLEEGLPDAAVVTQSGGMNPEARVAFLELFDEKPRGVLLALAVMGGLFGEGVDLPGDRLSGAAVVGVGLPQVCLERDILRDRYGGMGGGFSYAYVYPGMTRVVQAAGRVIRSSSDRGVVLLIDSRFRGEPYNRLLPVHWEPRLAFTADHVERLVTGFWKAD